MEIHYYPGNFQTDELEKIVKAACQEAADLFSVPQRRLTKGYFSVTLRPIMPPERLTHDLVVYVTMHAFAERLGDTDGSARELARRISRQINPAEGTRRSVAASLLFAEVGWGSSE